MSILGDIYRIELLYHSWDIYIHVVEQASWSAEGALQLSFELQFSNSIDFVNAVGR